MTAPAVPPTTAPMIAPRAVEPVWLPTTAPAAAPVVAPITAPLALLDWSAAHPGKRRTIADVVARFIFRIDAPCVGSESVYPAGSAPGSADSSMDGRSKAVAFSDRFYLLPLESCFL